MPHDSVILSAAVGAISGVGIGILLDKGTVNDSRVMRAQAHLRSYTPLRVFWAAAASGSLVVTAIKYLSPFLTESIEILPKPVALSAQVVGGGILGAGMYISGASCGTLLAQTGASMKEAGFTLPGSLVGSMLYVKAEPWLMEVLPEGESWPNLAESLGIPFWFMSLGMTMIVWGGLILIESAYPWVQHVEDEDNLILEDELTIFTVRLHHKSWPADLVGLGLGVLQVPCFLFTNTGVGISSAFVVLAEKTDAAWSAFSSAFPAVPFVERCRAMLPPLLSSMGRFVQSSAAESVSSSLSSSVSSATATPVSASPAVPLLSSPVDVTMPPSLADSMIEWGRSLGPVEAFEICIALGIVAGAALSSWCSGERLRRRRRSRRISSPLDAPDTYSIDSPSVSSTSSPALSSSSYPSSSSSSQSDLFVATEYTSRSSKHKSAAMAQLTLGEKTWLFAGGVLISFGSLVADGGVSGHGITGFAQFGLGSIVATTSMSVCALVAAQMSQYIPGQRSLKFRRESVLDDQSEDRLTSDDWAGR